MKKKHRFAFAGFRHPHIMALWEAVQKHPDCEVVAAWEGDAITARQLQEKGLNLTHDDYSRMLEESGATVVAIGDVYASRGGRAIAALRAGKQVISDKPICTSLEELEEITTLAREKGLSVGCQLDLREAASVRALKEVIQSGELGELCTVTIGAQHPLRRGSRAAWYFEPGRHGGTINDIGVHVFDLVPWLSGRNWERLISAREWNAKAKDVPHFKDCAQFHAVLAGGATCFSDVSYLAPDGIGYDLPAYWRIAVHGTRGTAEISYGAPAARVVTDEDKAPREVMASGEKGGGYLDDFVAELDGTPSQDGLTTARVLEAAEWALRAQRQAARGKSRAQLRRVAKKYKSCVLS